ncbi:hypothetical protein L798_07077 [Zootermopsis nevadensis]|uniref:Uncharacterized protein n=1 Tax=Zootermopsis nevadensis TaxID=136037 RepID=A0A067RFA6_ZOONE|nr:hypothetical protein L798_07077 [Zootermopsis nevadensis]
MCLCNSFCRYAHILRPYSYPIRPMTKTPGSSAQDQATFGQIESMT